MRNTFSMLLWDLLDYSAFESITSVDIDMEGTFFFIAEEEQDTDMLQGRCYSRFLLHFENMKSANVD